MVCRAQSNKSGLIQVLGKRFMVDVGVAVGIGVVYPYVLSSFRFTSLERIL